MKKHCIQIACACMLLTACTGPFAPIMTNDLDQAEFVNGVFAKEPALRDRFEVVPGTRTTTVVFKDDLPPGKEALFIERMKQMKEIMLREFGGRTDALVFRFPSKEIRI